MTEGEHEYEPALRSVALLAASTIGVGAALVVAVTSFSPLPPLKAGDRRPVMADAEITVAGVARRSRSPPTRDVSLNEMREPEGSEKSMDLGVIWELDIVTEDDVIETSVLLAEAAVFSTDVGSWTGQKLHTRRAWSQYKSRTNRRKPVASKVLMQRAMASSSKTLWAKQAFETDTPGYVT